MCYKMKFATFRKYTNEQIILVVSSFLQMNLQGWLWLKDPSGEWQRRWVVLCGPTLNIYSEQDEQSPPELTVELSSVTGYSEIPTESKYGFQVR